MAKINFLLIIVLIATGTAANARAEGQTDTEQALGRLQAEVNKMNFEVRALEARLAGVTNIHARQAAHLHWINAGVELLEARQLPSAAAERASVDPELRMWRSLAAAAESVLPAKDPSRAPAILPLESGPRAAPTDGALLINGGR